MSVRCSVPALAGGLDRQVARAEQALDDPLVEEHRVDPLERDLDARLRQPAAPGDHPVGGEHEHRGHPVDVLVRRSTRPPPRGARAPAMLAAVPASPSTITAATTPSDDGDDEEQRRRCQVHPVGPEVEDHLLTVVEMLLGEGHGRSVGPATGWCPGAQPQPSSCSRSSSMPKWWPTSWMTVVRTSRDHLGLGAAGGEDGPPVDRDAVGHRHEPVGLVPLGQRDALVEAHQVGAPAVLHHDHDVVHQAGDLVGHGVEPVRHQLLEALLGDLQHPLSILAPDGPLRCCWPGWTRRSAAPSPPTRTRCASWPAPGRARPGSSPAASRTGRRPARADPRHVLALTFTRKAAAELATRLAALGLRDRPTAGTFHADRLAQLSSRARSEGRRAAGPARPQGDGSLGPHPRPHEPHDGARAGRRRSSGRRRGGSAPTRLRAGRRGRRPTHRPARRPGRVALPALRGREAAAPGHRLRRPAGRLRAGHGGRTGPSPTPSGGASATCSSTSSRT